MTMLNLLRSNTSSTLVAGLFLSILWGGCATREKTPEPQEMTQETTEQELPRQTGSEVLEQSYRNLADERYAKKEEIANKPDAFMDKDSFLSRPAEEKEGGNIYFAVEKGAPEKNPEPLPDYYPLYVKRFEGEKQVSSYLAFRAWDFNKDGAFDMLEELDTDGSVISRSYDYNGDGIIDAEEK